MVDLGIEIVCRGQDIEGLGPQPAPLSNTTLPRLEPKPAAQPHAEPWQRDPGVTQPMGVHPGGTLAQMSTLEEVPNLEVTLVDACSRVSS